MAEPCSQIKVLEVRKIGGISQLNKWRANERELQNHAVKNIRQRWLEAEHLECQFNPYETILDEGPWRFTKFKTA